MMHGGFAPLVAHQIKAEVKGKREEAGRAGRERAAGEDRDGWRIFSDILVLHTFPIGKHPVWDAGEGSQEMVQTSRPIRRAYVLFYVHTARWYRIENLLEF